MPVREWWMVPQIRKCGCEHEMEVWGERAARAAEKGGGSARLCMCALPRAARRLEAPGHHLCELCCVWDWELSIVGIECVVVTR